LPIRRFFQSAFSNRQSAFTSFSIDYIHAS
jgi:hypothetical protein